MAAPIPFPIVARELSVACQRPGFHRKRTLVAAGVILLVGIILGLVYLTSQGGGGIGIPVGKLLFEILKWLCFLAAGFSGLVLTSDSISEEKREGTLGLLFLTDLHSLDILLGKLATHSLRAIGAFLAGFPVIATCFLLGGVTATEFLRVLAALLNTLFLSLSAGLLVSALSRETARTMSITLGFLLFELGGWSLLDHGIGLATGNNNFLVLSHLSPTMALVQSSAGNAAPFWIPMGWTFLTTLGCLATAVWTLPRHWQARDERVPKRRRSVPFDSSRLSTPHRNLLDQEPLVWLGARYRTGGRILLVGAVGLAVLLLFKDLAGPSPNAVPGAIDQTGYMLAFLFTVFARLWFTLHVCRFWTDARSTGAMELLLTTPIRGPQILDAQARAALRVFALPILALMLIDATTAFTRIQEFLEIQRKSFLAAGPTFSAKDIANMLGQARRQMTIEAAIGLLGQVTSLLALLRVGTWVGLRTPRIQYAVGKTLLLGDILPGLACLLFGILVQTQFHRFPIGPYLQEYSNELRAFCGSIPFLLVDITLAGFALRASRKAFQPFATGITP